ncbi:MAG: preprotein translocase subunit YajC [Gammaproteobacteria bacterium]|nr:MAG: preprotein translocase subunit YajC [Gammaproteobacteria bacterium]
MSFFISDAYAQAAPAGGETGMLTFLPIIILFVIFYFLLMRPQMKRAKEHKSMLASLAKGDEVVTSGGLLGRITEMGEDFVSIEIAPGVITKLQKHAVAAVMPKGTLKDV